MTLTVISEGLLSGCCLLVNGFHGLLLARYLFIVITCQAAKHETFVNTEHFSHGYVCYWSLIEHVVVCLGNN